MTQNQPAFATLTGCAQPNAIKDMQGISRVYPNKVEFGILIDEVKFGSPRFPNENDIEIFRRSGLRLSAHLCGSLAEAIFAGEDIAFDLSGFSRIQVNLVGRHATPQETENAIRFGKTRGVRTILQCEGQYPNDTRCDWLLDSSFGTGRAVTQIPDMDQTSAFCGVSGGLDAATIEQTLNALRHVDRPFWVDAESGLFDGIEFSTELCRAFLARIFR